MTNSVLKRWMSFIPTLFLISILVFLALRLVPGEPLSVLYGTEQGMSIEMKVALERKLGLDQPLILQYFHWLERFITGDWGVSIFNHLPVFELVSRRLPWTFFLTVTSMFVGLCISVPLGIIAAIRHNSVVDYAVLITSLIGQSIPSFLLAILLILSISLKLQILPSFGAINPFDAPWPAIRHLLLPSLTLGLGMAAVLIRLIRSSLLEELGALYVTNARAKGLGEGRVVLTHVLRNALIPILTIIGLWFSMAMSGSVIIETIFAWPGIGQLLYQSVLNRDYPVVQSIVVLVAVITVGVNFMVDMLYIAIDPRVKESI